jgi:hypothetical protein
MPAGLRCHPTTSEFVYAAGKTKKGVPLEGPDGLPLYRYQAVLGDDCGNKDDGYKLNYYWRIAERCGWDGLAPLDACQGLADF